MPELALISCFATATRRGGAAGHNRAPFENRLDLLWSGRQSLAVSFWCAYVPSLIFAKLAGEFVILKWAGAAKRGIGMPLGAVLTILVLLLISIIGTWRSGQNFKGEARWVSLSRVTMIAGALGVAISMLIQN